MSRVLELVYTAWDLQGFAGDFGISSPPFIWNNKRRHKLCCELDAGFFLLYGFSHNDVDYILDTFPIVMRKDIDVHGDYITKQTVLGIYDAMKVAIDRGEPYQTLLDPPPADLSVAHPPKSN